jgi:hypothetical protein
MLAALSGLLLGAWHVASGPDHLAALAPLAARGGARSPWRAGLAWGLGHASGVWLVGLLLIAFGSLLPLDSLGLWSERIVGAMIVGVGVWGLWQARHAHDHAHDHARGPAFVIGIVHGLAGSAHLYGVLPALALGEGERLAYLIAFGVGSVLAMAGFSSLLALLVERLPGSRETLRRGALRVGSIIAIVVGLAWLVMSCL